MSTSDLPSRLLLTAAAAILMAIGLAFLFAPDELAELTGAPGGALGFALGAGPFVGLALLNWMSRSLRVAGIYGRPLGLANAATLLIVALAAMRAAQAGMAIPATASLACVSGVVGIGFIWATFFRRP